MKLDLLHILCLGLRNVTAVFISIFLSNIEILREGEMKILVSIKPALLSLSLFFNASIDE